MINLGKMYTKAIVNTLNREKTFYIKIDKIDPDNYDDEELLS